MNNKLQITTQAPKASSKKIKQKKYRATNGTQKVSANVLKAEESALHRKAGELQDFFETSTIGLHWVGPDGTILWANKADYEPYGYTEGEYIGHNITKFHADQDVIQDILTRLTNNEKLINYPARLLAKDGSIKHVLINSSVLWKDGKFVHTRCFTRDVTEMKELEMRKDDFINMASHELRTPITSAKIYTQLLHQHLEKLKDEKATTTVTKLEKQIDKLTELVFQLLDINKMQAGKLSYTKKRFDFDLLINESVELQQLATRHQIAIEGSTKKQLYGDESRIGQVLLNLIGNAVKYSPKADKVLIDVSSDNEEIKVAIQDFGIGVPKEYQEKIFERFFRIYDNRDKTYPGLGMGLYIALEIIHNHGGKLWVESEDGAGSIFYFTLPLKHSIV